MAMGRSHRVAWVCGCLLVLFFWWDWGVAVWGGLALWKRGVWGRFLFWYGGRFNSIRGMVDLLLHMGNRSNGSSFVIVETIVLVAFPSC